MATSSELIPNPSKRTPVISKLFIKPDIPSSRLKMPYNGFLSVSPLRDYYTLLCLFIFAFESTTYTGLPGKTWKQQTTASAVSTNQRRKKYLPKSLMGMRTLRSDILFRGSMLVIVASEGSATVSVFRWVTAPLIPKQKPLQLRNGYEVKKKT